MSICPCYEFLVTFLFCCFIPPADTALHPQLRPKRDVGSKLVLCDINIITV